MQVVSLYTETSYVPGTPTYVQGVSLCMRRTSERESSSKNMKKDTFNVFYKMHHF